MAVWRAFNTLRRFATTFKGHDKESNLKFEHVFSFPSVAYFALLNRLKVYHLYGSAVVVPSVGLMEMGSIMPESSFLGAAYIGLTGGIVLSLTTLPFRNIIGHIYISEDNKLIKISSVDFFGRRQDRIVKSDEWIPLLEMEPRYSDAFYLSPQLTDGTKYKLLVKFGMVKNSKKMGEVLE